MNSNSPRQPGRRRFLHTLATLSLTAPAWSVGAMEPALHLATNEYPWGTFYGREGRDFGTELNAAMKEASSAGLQGWEPIANLPADLDRMAPLLKSNGLEIRSLYVNSVLHDAAQARQSQEAIMAVARRARDLGTRIIVTNPSPLSWGGTVDKNDDQLHIQARALDHLGAALRKMGMMLAYHNHDAELRQGAREFHHMLTATNPDNVKLCLDAHWVFRGCGNSEVAVFDALSHYYERIVELHLRQSQRGVWSEVFSLVGDIDYWRLIAFLTERGIHPHLVLEQAVERGSQKTLTAAQAHQIGAENLRRLLI